MSYLLGIDIGSTTAKAVLQKGDQILYQTYQRHLSQVREKCIQILQEIQAITGQEPVALAVSGSAGLGLAKSMGVPFVQEVYASAQIVKEKEPDTQCVIELGGEDAKIIFFSGGIDERMNGSCAGGTGAFIDQMATLLDVTPDELDELSLRRQRIYPIASRCGVFAKTDIQPLLNQGARKEDVAASVYQAVVNQTIAGLAQGRQIGGKVLFLGGPLYYCKGLRRAFLETLDLEEGQAVFPEYARTAVAMGASLYAAKEQQRFPVPELIRRLEENPTADAGTERMERLFPDAQSYAEFKQRHSRSTVPSRELAGYQGAAYLGIDCGSTTTKLTLISQDREILYSYYSSNRGNPVEIIKEQLQKIYALCGEKIQIRGSAVTGYGEELIRHAFRVDRGVVETIAHYTAAKYFDPQVDFILDIGGQDIKCFKIVNGAIDSIMLNEACSSGCGSFLETFARSMGYSIEEFARLGLEAKAPVNLGSRCTVFMNSSVKQSHKEGATVEDISAGLAISVVKNALYKVIRVGSASELGEHIVVQGGTFYNDAVLRAFELELGHVAIRPDIAGLMGAFGAALVAMDCGESRLISREELASFQHSSKSAICQGCTNHCHLTVNSFGGGEKFISGNQCEKGLGREQQQEPLPNLHAFKRDYLTSLPRGENKLGRVGLPLALGMYELLPLWNGIFTHLGFQTILSEMSTRRTYEKGQFSIPSDTACYPAKLMHGHMEELLDQGPELIFYPCLSYNVDEGVASNHYNCPVVAYYSELLAGNIDRLRNSQVKFLYPYLNINQPRQLSRELYAVLKPLYPISYGQVKAAVRYGFSQYEAYLEAVRREGERAVALARSQGRRTMILAGRPYHVDAQIDHGIDKLANSLGFVVVSEDSICHLAEMPQGLQVLNQWTYHARLYRAAQYAAEHEDTELVQLVSFGCGVDAITTDEVRRLLESKGKFYTQLKIDEITNLGAVRIRLRSLLGALEEKKGK